MYLPAILCLTAFPHTYDSNVEGADSSHADHGTPQREAGHGGQGQRRSVEANPHVEKLCQEMRHRC